MTVYKGLIEDKEISAPRMFLYILESGFSSVSLINRGMILLMPFLFFIQF